jgi:hypothetical protein
MSIQDKIFARVKMKPWYWFLALAGSVLIIGGIIGLVVL